MATRRQVLRMVGAAAAAAIAVRPARAAASAPPVRPNFLWISCEDTSPTLGCYGDPLARTPALDALAAEGVRFTRAFAVAGVCAPSRSAIITGVYPTTLGTHHMRCKVPPPDAVKCFTEYLRQAGYYCSNNVKTDYNFPVPKGAWDDCSASAHWRNRPAGRPFFAVFNFTVTHEGQIRRDPEAHARQVRRLSADQRQDPARMVVPPFHPDTPLVRRQWAQYYECVTAMDYEAGDLLRQLRDDGLADQTIVFFWSDHGTGLPRCKRWLYDSGTRVPLIVRVPERLRTADQARAGTACDDLVSLLDLGPTVLNLAGLPVPAVMQGRPVLGPNLPPPRQYVYGARDRMDERYDVIRSVRDGRYRYIRNYMPHRPYYQHMNTPEGGGTMMELRRLYAEGRLPGAAAAFMADSKPPEELYDLSTDPHEVRNLVGSPDHGDVLQRLRRAHGEWMLETLDLGLLPEDEIARRAAEAGSAYAILRRPGGIELLQRLRTVATLPDEGPAAEGRLVEALADADPAVRYWAVVGLDRICGRSGPAVERLRAAMKDPSPSVRVAAARAAAVRGSQADALAVLETELRGPREHVRLLSAIALDDLGEAARPVLPAVEAACSDKENQYVGRVAGHIVARLKGGDGRDRPPPENR